jgi:hypothetical protein
MQEEEREKRDNYCPEVSEVKTSDIEIDKTTYEMLESLGLENLSGVIYHPPEPKDKDDVPTNVQRRGQYNQRGRGQRGGGARGAGRGGSRGGRGGERRFTANTGAAAGSGVGANLQQRPRNTGVNNSGSNNNNSGNRNRTTAKPKNVQK